MDQQSFNITITVDKTPHEVYEAINNVRGWWSEEIEGRTDLLNEVFDYHYRDVHRVKAKIIEMIPGQKVVWQVLDNYFNFTKDKSEWIGTKVIFEITEQDGRTQLHFTHEGLVPAYECYNICFDAWSNYIKHSLYNLVMTGKGDPNAKEDNAFQSSIRDQFEN